MIINYPEEFIVPVEYVEDFKDKTCYRLEDIGSLNGSKLLMPDEELKENELFLAKVDMHVTFKNKPISLFNIDEEIFQEPMINKDIVEAELGDENIKSILRDIDEDYANSQTLNINSEYKFYR